MTLSARFAKESLLVLSNKCYPEVGILLPSSRTHNDKCHHCTLVSLNSTTCASPRKCTRLSVELTLLSGDFSSLSNESPPLNGEFPSRVCRWRLSSTVLRRWIVAQKVHASECWIDASELWIFPNERWISPMKRWIPISVVQVKAEFDSFKAMIRYAENARLWVLNWRFWEVNFPHWAVKLSLWVVNSHPGSAGEGWVWQFQGDDLTNHHAENARVWFVELTLLSGEFLSLSGQSPPLSGEFPSRVCR
jgi:hypothetical protein